MYLFFQLLAFVRHAGSFGIECATILQITRSRAKCLGTMPARHARLLEVEILLAFSVLQRTTLSNQKLQSK